MVNKFIDDCNLVSMYFQYLLIWLMSSQSLDLRLVPINLQSYCSSLIIHCLKDRNQE